MPRKFWWVNHKKTVRQEIGGGYLWSPKTEANGRRSQFYDNMRRAQPGDFVLSFANAAVGALGIVTAYAVPSLKPDEFSSVDAGWGREGWYLPVNWRGLRTSVRPKTHIDEISPLLPKKYSPINPASGNGNEKAYLAEIDQPVFDIVLRDQEDIVEALSRQVIEAVQPSVILDNVAEKQIRNDPNIEETEKEQMILARRGQGQFRSGLLNRYEKCLITGIEDPTLLVASHIKPWRISKDAAERLDIDNGLLLSPNMDRVFDRGFISFSESGKILLSNALNQSDFERLGVTEEIAENFCASFSDKTMKYLEYHRESVFIS